MSRFSIFFNWGLERAMLCFLYFVFVFLELLLDISWHRYVEPALLVIPLESNAAI